MKLKFVKLNAFLFLILFVLFSCSKDPEIIIETVEVVKEVEVTVTETVTVELDPFADSTLEGVLTSDKTLSSDKIWLIKGRVVVGEGNQYKRRCRGSSDHVCSCQGNLSRCGDYISSVVPMLS